MSPPEERQSIKCQDCKSRSLIGELPISEFDAESNKNIGSEELKMSQFENIRTNLPGERTNEGITTLLPNLIF